MSDYVLRVRDPRTLKLVAMLPQYDGVTWTRRDLEAGSFQLDIFLDQLDDVADVARNNILEVVRDGTFEFAGVIRRSAYSALDRKFVLSGPDIKGFWLANREIDPGASEFDVQSGVVGETAMIHYVNDHLIAPSDSTRKMANELTSPITATARATAGKGSSVDFNARWENLLKLLVEIGERADLTHDIVISPNFTGYEYQVSVPTDATQDTGTTPIIFSVQWDNVGDNDYEENYLRVANAVFVLADGTGTGRTVREVKDTTSITDDFRVEAHMDARQADSTARQDEQGNLKIARLLADAITAKATPLTVADEAYRTDWDLGYDVSIAFNDIGKTLDRRIKEVKITLVRQQETIQVSFGQPPRTLARLIDEVTNRSVRAQVL